MAVLLLSLLGLIKRIEASPISSTRSGSEALLIPLTRVTAQKDSKLSQLPSNVLKKRSIQSGTSTAYVSPVGMVGYAGHILVGTPPQRISVLFDTGSDLVLTISDKCQGEECAELTHFSCSASSTCVDLGGDGSGNGVCSSENDCNDDSDSNIADDGDTALAQDITHHPPMKNNKNPKGTLGNGPLTSQSQELADVGQVDSSKAHKPKDLSKTLSPTKGNEDDDHQITKRLIGPAGVMKIEQGLHPLDTADSNTNSIGSGSAKSPSPIQTTTATAPWTDYYNQTYVDGTWGAGTFIRDRIQIDMTQIGQVYNPYLAEQNPNAQVGRSASVTFLDVVQDNLELVKGYDGQISGLIGLSRSSPTGRKTFLQEMAEQGSLPSPVVSMHLETEGSSFLLGGINHSQYTGDLIYFPVTDPIIWQVSLQGIGTRPTMFSSSSSSIIPNSEIGVNIGSSSAPLGHDFQSGSKMIPNTERFQDAPLILDSGTSAILIPIDASLAINTELSGTWDPIHMAWFLPCTGPDLVWWLSSKHAIVQPYESLVYKLEDGSCQSLIFGNNAKYWILGDVWLRGLYVVYDMEDSGRIGIASAISPNSDGSGPRSGVDRDGSGSGGVGGAGAARARVLTFHDSSSALYLEPSFFVTMIWVVFINWSCIGLS
ncbi:hypothetical protein BGZ76_003602 [Entomortierella beljakovae]|nr:hypothetical protein BGZ76_003602 [Entomortierella beljakovae]